MATWCPCCRAYSRTQAAADRQRREELPEDDADEPDVQSADGEDVERATGAEAFDDLVAGVGAGAEGHGGEDTGHLGVATSEVAGEGLGDPAASFGSGGEDRVAVAAAEYLEEIRAQGFRPDEVQPIKIGALAAYRASGGAGSPAGPISVVLTWIAYNDSIYRLTGSGTGRTSKRHLGTFINVARSFRPLTELLRRSIRETRLHITTAREGESLGQLGERMQNEWDVQRTAVMNDLFANQPLAAGQLVKVAVSHLYEPTPDAR